MNFSFCFLTVITTKGFVNSELSGDGSIPRETNISDSLSKRIINGEDAKVDRKFYVLIRDEKGNFCGATLIRPQFLLTAAHCFVGIEGKLIIFIFPELSFIFCKANVTNVRTEARKIF